MYHFMINPVRCVWLKNHLFRILQLNTAAHESWTESWGILCIIPTLIRSSLLDYRWRNLVTRLAATRPIHMIMNIKSMNFISHFSYLLLFICFRSARGLDGLFGWFSLCLEISKYLNLGHQQSPAKVSTPFVERQMKPHSVTLKPESSIATNLVVPT